MATVLVGRDETPFKVHDRLLCEQSPFFQQALGGNFKEAREQVVRLPEEEPERFERFLLWLYTHSLAHIDHRDVDRRYESLFELYFLADRLLVRALKNAIIDATVRVEQTSAFVPSTYQVQTVFAQTAACRENGLRRLLVDMHAWDVDPKFIAEHEDWFGKDFLLDLALVGMRFREAQPQQQAPFVRDPSSYYDDA
jgi:hypothetical protein